MAGCAIEGPAVHSAHHSTCGCKHGKAGSKSAASRPATAPATRRAATAPAARVSDARTGFSIVPPAGYACTGGSIQHFLNFLGPQERGLTVNFNVTARRDDGTPVEKGFQRSRTILRVLLKDYRQIEEGMTTIGGRESYFCSGTFEWKGARCRNLQYFVRGDRGQVFVITFASLESSFDSHRRDFEHSAATARLD